MKNKIIRTALFMLLVLVCEYSNAQVSNFTGTTVSVAINTISTHAKTIDVDGVSGDYLGAQSWNGSIHIGKSIAIRSKNTLSFGATYLLKDSKIASFSSSAVGISNKNQFSLQIEPGYLVDQKTLVYGKLSYEIAKNIIFSEVRGSSGINGVNTSSWDYVQAESKKIKGIGFGVGAKTALDKKNFFQIEFKQIYYNAHDYNGAYIKPYGLMGSLGIGWNI